MSCEGTMTGSPCAVCSTLFDESMSVRASICASSEMGRCTAIWSPSKSALNAAQTGRGRHRVAAAAVVQQRIDRVLEHALLVAHDDLRRLELEEPLEAVVAVDDAAVEVVQVGRREAPAVERYQRTKIRRKHRQHFHDH